LGKIIRRKLIPNLEHVTWRDPTVTPSRLAISSRLIPAATNSLIFSIACGVNLTRLPPLAEGLFVIVMATPSVVAHRWSFGTDIGFTGPQPCLRLGSDTLCKIETITHHSLSNVANRQHSSRMFPTSGLKNGPRPSVTCPRRTVRRRRPSIAARFSIGFAARSSPWTSRCYRQADRRVVTSSPRHRLAPCAPFCPSRL